MTPILSGTHDSSCACLWDQYAPPWGWGHLGLIPDLDLPEQIIWGWESPERGGQAG